jgi:AraC-like DNA-binding protein
MPQIIFRIRGTNRKIALADPDRITQPAFVVSGSCAAGATLWHSHRLGQLMHVSEGVQTVATEQGVWVAPPHRAIWIPPGIRHRAAFSGPFSYCSLFVEPNLVKLPLHCCVVSIEPVVRELLLVAGRFGDRYRKGSAEARLIRVILDRLPTIPLAALSMPESSDRRLRRITQALRANPSDSRTLPDFSRACGIGYRTAERLFLRELGMSFGRWRRQLRLIAALERLAAGDSVADVAIDVGYSDVSAFIAMFKSALGATPSKYFST